jgi:hypothetical protein
MAQVFIVLGCIVILASILWARAIWPDSTVAFSAAKEIIIQARIAQSLSVGTGGSLMGAIFVGLGLIMNQLHHLALDVETIKMHLPSGESE